MVLGKHRLTLDVSMNGKVEIEWKIEKKNPNEETEWVTRKIQIPGFQKFQMKVISTQNGYGLIAWTSKNPPVMNSSLLHDNDGYELIRTLIIFHMKSCYCSACRTYNDKLRNSYGGLCRCYRFNEENGKTNFWRCENLQKSWMFHDSQRLRNNGASYSDQLFACKECVYVSLLRGKEQDGTRKCGKICCKTCNAFVQQANHLCFWNLQTRWLLKKIDPAIYT